MAEDVSHLEFDLVPDDPSQYRSLVESEWATIRGKKNRIAIGTPVCAHEARVSKDGLLTGDDLRNYRRASADFYCLSFPLTLFPDVDCKFLSADVLLELDPIPGAGSLPFFIRLRPTQESSATHVKLKTKKDAKLSAKDGILKIVDAEAGFGEATELTFERTEVHVASLGLGTQSAGWRFRLIESQEVPLCADKLRALVAVPRNQRCKMRFRVTAQIDVKTGVDRFLTKLFLRNSLPEASADYQFP